MSITNPGTIHDGTSPSTEAISPSPFDAIATGTYNRGVVVEVWGLPCLARGSPSAAPSCRPPARGPCNGDL